MGYVAWDDNDYELLFRVETYDTQKVSVPVEMEVEESCANFLTGFKCKVKKLVDSFNHQEIDWEWISFRTGLRVEYRKVLVKKPQLTKVCCDGYYQTKENTCKREWGWDGVDWYWVNDCLLIQLNVHLRARRASVSLRILVNVRVDMEERAVLCVSWEGKGISISNESMRVLEIDDEVVWKWISLISACSTGYWGPSCKRECDCSNGEGCDPESGVCHCKPGELSYDE